MTQTQNAPAPDANDVLMGGGGAPTAKFHTPGTSVGGRITLPPKAHQEREFKPGGQGAPKFYPSGDPIYGVTVQVQTNLRDPAIADDDGQRRLFVEGKRMKEAVRDAVHATGEAKLLQGGELHVTYIGDGQAENGLNAPKLYQALYVPPAQVALGTPTPTPQAPVQPAPPVTTAAVGTPPAEPPATQFVNSQGQPATREAIAALKAAGVDPIAVYPGYDGSLG